MLYKLEMNLYILNKKIKNKGYFKQRTSILNYLIDNTKIGEEHEFFYLEIYKLMTWDHRSLSCMVPYSRSNITTSMNEGDNGSFFVKYLREN